MITGYGAGSTGPSNNLPCRCYRFSIPTVPGSILDAPWGYVPCPEHAVAWAAIWAGGSSLLTCGDCGQSWVQVMRLDSTAKCPACGSVKEVAHEGVDG